MQTANAARGGCGDANATQPGDTLATHSRLSQRPALVLALGALACGMLALTPHPSPHLPAQPSETSVLAPASPDQARPSFDALLRAFDGTKGIARPSQDAVMGFNLPTSVNATAVKAIMKRGGAEVTKGETILKGDDAEDQILLRLQQERLAKPLAVDRAKAAMDLSEVEYTRVREAFGRGGSGTQEVDRARLQAEVSRIDWELAVSNDKQEKLQLERIQERIRSYTIAAPFDGTVDLVNADVGQVVAGNEKVVRVVDVDPLWVDVPEPTDRPHTWAMNVGTKAWALAEVAGQARLIECSVIEVSPTADPASRTRRLRVEVPNPAGVGGSRLLAGEPLWIRFASPDAEVLKLLDAAPLAKPLSSAPAEVQRREPAVVSVGESRK